MERKYPCEAVVANVKNLKFAVLKTPLIVTVLEPAKILSCACGGRKVHPIELPDGYPDPPGKCGFWTALPEQLEFLEVPQ